MERLKMKQHEQHQAVSQQKDRWLGRAGGLAIGGSTVQPSCGPLQKREKT
jgi:hypothetical protein